MLDALASNEYFRIVTGGGGFGRTDKVEMLAPFPPVLAALKVCFVAAGLPDPPCFAEPLTPAHIEALRLPSRPRPRDPHARAAELPPSSAATVAT